MNKKIRFLFAQVLIISLIVGMSSLSVSAMPMTGMGSPDKQDNQQMQAMVKEAMMKPEMKDMMMGMMKETAMKPEAKTMTLSTSETQQPPSANQAPEPEHKADHDKHQQK